MAKAVARLESRLGVRLFQRTTRSQRLTDDGQAYYERCRRALAELDAADAALEAGRHAPTGTLRATMPALFGRVCLTPALLALARDHPQLKLDLHFSDRRVDLVEDGFDLAAQRRARRQHHAGRAPAGLAVDGRLCGTGLAGGAGAAGRFHRTAGAARRPRLRRLCARRPAAALALPPWDGGAPARRAGPGALRDRTLPLRTRVAVDALAAAVPALLAP
ncbi:LysR family transcriptional regulator [Xylophilus sp.]|uniref:LysR family transcriptional regulator n=1 Tax=Xylophilus sp. TaxID=2653893 RepID=UPI002D7FFE8F|nr:LysR family transcriptional regulator [Xylophilus sp.]